MRCFNAGNHALIAVAMPKCKRHIYAFCDRMQCCPACAARLFNKGCHIMQGRAAGRGLPEIAGAAALSLPESRQKQHKYGDNFQPSGQH
ncbi:MAG: hypothetical protein DU429_02875 [Candidatus Tokpelaia sp.]|nr:MAG: hypothetical protein DU430_05630 [Candidatus Tokpelaia sp.]KAA6207410.1 MAG: hypothetical protein DU429_02875 [Candidatus Tokpelaia sp.]